MSPRRCLLDVPLPILPKHPCCMPQAQKVLPCPWQTVVSGRAVVVLVLSLSNWHSPQFFVHFWLLKKGLLRSWGSCSIFKVFSNFSKVFLEADWKTVPFLLNEEKGGELKSVTQENSPNSFLTFVFYRYSSAWPEWWFYFKAIIMTP